MSVLSNERSIARVHAHASTTPCFPMLGLHRRVIPGWLKVPSATGRPPTATRLPMLPLRVAGAGKAVDSPGSRAGGWVHAYAAHPCDVPWSLRVLPLCCLLLLSLDGAATLHVHASRLHFSQLPEQLRCLAAHDLPVRSMCASGAELLTFMGQVFSRGDSYMPSEMCSLFGMHRMLALLPSFGPTVTAGPMPGTACCCLGRHNPG